MSDLVEFLRARLDEDERAARAAMIDDRSGRDRWSVGGSEPFDGIVRDGVGDRVADDAYPEHASHIARHDPARVLREVEGKRRIIAEHYPTDPCDAHDAAMNTIACDTLCLLALPYADHPDYQQKWRP